MTRFNPNMQDVTAGNLVLDAGEYVFLVGEPKGFHNKKEDQNTGADTSNYGVGFNLIVKTPGKYEGQSVHTRFYLHSPGSVKMTKQFLLAVQGFNVNSQTAEAEFNNKYSGQDWIDFDDLSVGEIYKLCAGRRVNANVSVKDNPMRDGELQNNYRWLPF